MVFQAVDIPTHKCIGDVDFGIIGAPYIQPIKMHSKAMLHCDWSIGNMDFC